MTFAIDFLDDGVYEWTVTPDGATHEVVEDYTPTVHVGREGGDLARLAAVYRDHPDVETVAVERRRPGWRRDEQAVLRLDLAAIDAVTPVAHEIAGWGDPGEYRLYGVDLSREFRYCLETGLTPVPDHEPTVLELALAPKHRSDGRLTDLRVGEETLTGDAAEVLAALAARLADVDPDVLVVGAAELVPLLYERADDAGVDFELGRLAGYQQLARESTFESYGRVGHSPARYNVPGRAIIDRSNTFFYTQTNLWGLFDLVERSAKPLQELAWASIGNVLTAIQIREARRRGVLVPWHSWRHEQFKPMSVLHQADRGGFTFAPDVGVHEDVYEVDYSSLYPNIIRTRNVSPERIRCDCHADRADVPDLGYSICDERGYLVDVLGPLIDDREAYKRALAETDDEARAADLRGRSEALKWILVSCFGYQGFSNAKFGRIECHEAINAYAREILLETKAAFEAAGWRVVHGIVDSLWVQPVADDHAPVADLCEQLTDAMDIPLDFEARYDWIAFVPRRDGETGALNRYVGKVAGAEEFTVRGIEARQRSTPAYVERCQRALLAVFDDTRDPAAVCDRLARQLARLDAGEVDPEELLVRNRVSKRLAEYEQATRNAAALARADRFEFAVSPGEDVRYLVVDDDRDGQDRVRLAFEDLEGYDADFYGTELVRAAESVVAPLGWDRERIREYLAETRDAAITSFG